MGVIVPVGEFQCVIQWSLQGDVEPMVCTLGIRSANGLTPEVCASEVFAAITGIGAPCNGASMLQQWSILGVTAYQRTADGFLVGENQEVLNGIAVGSGVPVNCAQLVTKVTNLGGRRNKGRMYVPPFSDAEANIDMHGSLLNLSGLQPRWDIFYDALVANVEIATPVLFHSDGGPSTPITGFRIESVLATQRQRMRP